MEKSGRQTSDLLLLMLQKTFIHMYLPLNNFAPLSSYTQAGFPFQLLECDHFPFAVLNIRVRTSNYSVGFEAEFIHASIRERKSCFFTPDLERIEF